MPITPDHADETADGGHRNAPEVAGRLMEAVRAAGGPSEVARRSEVPLRTLQNYLAGRGLKIGVLVKLAEVTGVRLDWLATGEGTMTAAEAGVPRTVGLADPQQAFATVRDTAGRLKAAIDAVGDPLAVAGQVGISVDALAAAISGEVELRISAAAALARACGVRLQWMASGEGPMRDEPAPVAKSNAFGSMDIDALAACLEACSDQFRRMGVANPPWRRLVQTALLLYDEMLAARANKT